MPMTKMYHSISGQIVGDTINSQTRSYLGDGFGNVVGTTNPDSTLQMWFVYRPYGSTASVTGTGVEPVVRWGGSRRMLVVDESNAEYGDARGGSYSVGEGQLTNGNYGEYELPGFPRDWNPLKRGEMPRITPMPPYKKPPRKNPPPVEIIPPPTKEPPIPGPVPPKRELLPGNGDDRANAARLRLVTCLGCCTWQAVGSGPIGNAIRIDLWLPKVSCIESDRFDLEPMPWPKFFPWKEPGVLEQTCLEEGWPPEFCKQLTPDRAPDNIGKLPDEVKDSLKKLDKFRSACEKLTCFGECWLEYEEGLVRAGNPVPWQLCGLEDDVALCESCCEAKLGSSAMHPLYKECVDQCGSHY